MIGTTSISRPYRASNSINSDLASPSFKFVVEGKSLYIHAGLIARHSKPLDRMINGSMSEAQDGVAVLPDVDRDTFLRFIRWAYTGTYCAAEFSAKQKYKCPPSAVASKESEKPKEVNIFGQYQTPIFYNEIGSPFQLVTNEEEVKNPKKQFAKLKYVVDETHVSVPKPRSNNGPGENYTEVFLSHARIYVFAEKYDIRPLKSLALQQLHSTLTIFKLYPERVGDISALLRYAYDNTAELQYGTEPLRALLTQYMGCEIGVLARDGEFQKSLLEDGGAMLGDFLKMVVDRIG